MCRNWLNSCKNFKSELHDPIYGGRGDISVIFHACIRYLLFFITGICCLSHIKHIQASCIHWKENDCCRWCHNIYCKEKDGEKRFTCWIELGILTIQGRFLFALSSIINRPIKLQIDIYVRLCQLFKGRKLRIFLKFSYEKKDNVEWKIVTFNVRLEWKLHNLTMEFNPVW